MRYWIGVASKEHVLAAVKGGFAQFGHGELAPAKRPAKGDWIIYYSAKEKFGDPAPCQRFVAIGKFLDAEPKQVTQAKGFKRWRRRVADPFTYSPGHSVLLAESRPSNQQRKLTGIDFSYFKAAAES